MLSIHHSLLYPVPDFDSIALEAYLELPRLRSVAFYEMKIKLINFLFSIGIVGAAPTALPPQTVPSAVDLNPVMSDFVFHRLLAPKKALASYECRPDKLLVNLMRQNSCFGHFI